SHFLSYSSTECVAHRPTLDSADKISETLRCIFQTPTVQYCCCFPCSTCSPREEGLRCGVVYLRTPTEQLQTIEQGSKTLICISFTKLNNHLLLERVFPNFIWMFIDCYSTASKFYKETPQIPDAKRIYEKTCYSHAASVVPTVTPVCVVPVSDENVFCRPFTSTSSSLCRLGISPVYLALGIKIIPARSLSERTTLLSDQVL
ncbi:hypothetical protein CSKR_107976, partial [Clonorchis sinensis]